MRKLSIRSIVAFTMLCFMALAVSCGGDDDDTSGGSQGGTTDGNFTFVVGESMIITNFSMQTTIQISSKAEIVDDTSTEMGICYSSEISTPTVSSDKTISKGVYKSGIWSANIFGLNPSTKYYFRPYVKFGNMTYYGAAKSFTTSKTSAASHDYVDLGLSVKWATCNVGASKPEEYGYHFAWGETTTKDTYDETTYKYYNSSTGYINIGSEISGTQYDAATANWGSPWRMPTLDQCKELVEKCNWKWIPYNGVNGQLVTGPNGKSIFLPAAGVRWGGTLSLGGSRGYYWSGTLCPDNSDHAYYLGFGSGGGIWRNNLRSYGLSVRAVCP